ncbi:MAG: class II aldolase/adducin family protein [Anaerolineaceae bacterium]|nr:class II aldolase/adducin family protein [Anaerolineaceae bacterium]
MAKRILTDRDIEDLARQGAADLMLDADTLLTDLAYEKASRLGIKVKAAGQSNTPNLPQPTAPVIDSGRNLLHSSPQASEAELRAAIIETGRIAYQSGLMISNDGNISTRLADGNILITPAGVCKGRISPSDLLVVDINGRLVKPAADPALKASSEQPMHLQVYRLRPDVRAVIHTHLVFANALVISKGSVRMDVIPEAAVAFGSIPVTDYAMPSSTQNADAIRDLIPNHNVIMIRNHGSLTVGANLEEALILLERLEHVARTLTYAELLGEIKPLPPEMLRAISQASQKSNHK